MTTTGKASFYLIVLKVWAMELQDRRRFFFSDNVQSANVSVQKEKCNGRKTTLHVNTAKKKQGTVQVMVNLSFTTQSFNCDFLSRIWLWQFRRWAFDWSFQKETHRNRDKHSKKEKHTYVRYIFIIYLETFKNTSRNSMLQKPTTLLHLFYHICVIFFRSTFCSHLYFVRGSS